MALKAVAARIQGDLLQGMFFWYQAAHLLRPGSPVSKVVIEFDRAAGVDDIAVFYDPPGPVQDGSPVTADFFQTKFHVDRSDEYDSDKVIDPGFIARKQSLLAHFGKAHLAVESEHPAHRLHLVSNWQWKRDDPLGPLLREWYGGALPNEFFTAGPKSDLGKVREKWRAHLGFEEDAFTTFARALRFGVDFLARPPFVELLNGTFARCGLKEIPEDRMANPYDSLTQQLVTSGHNEFTREDFRKLCERENLLESPRDPRPATLGIRSFRRFAERFEDETDKFICFLDQFDGRYIKDPSDWSRIVLPRLREFLSSGDLRKCEHWLLLDCHVSVAFMAGYELPRKTGALVYPVQKGGPDTLWKPSGTANEVAWTFNEEPGSESAEDIAIAVSVSREVVTDVKAYVKASGLAVRCLLDARPSGGVGGMSVQSADQALALADKLSEEIRRIKAGRGVAHLFVAAPNGLLFFLGQLSGALGPLRLYEFDFEGQRGGTYAPSITLPDVDGR